MGINQDDERHKKKYKKNKKSFMAMRKELRKKKVFKDNLKKMSITSERFAYKVPCDELEVLK